MSISFFPAVFYPAGDSPYGIVTADFNGDGIKDLAMATVFRMVQLQYCLEMLIVHLKQRYLIT